MVKYQRVFNLALIISFLLILIIPCTHIDYNTEKSEKEKRYFAKYEHIILDGSINLNYGKNFEAWFNDRYFGREFLLKLNDFFKINHANSSVGNKDVLVGKDGWLFCRADGSESNYSNIRLFSDAEIEGIFNYLAAIHQWCANNDKTFLFFIAPDKNRVYPEYYPDSIRKIRNDSESRTSQFVNYVKEHSDISIIYPLEEIISAKSSGQLLYYKNDTHWNDYGAYIRFKRLERELLSINIISPLDVSGWENKTYPVGDLNNLYPEGGDRVPVHLIPLPYFFETI